MYKIHDLALDLTHFHHIDINLYPLFIAIYEQNSISQAAQQLHISQSAASHALQRLRQHLKDDLFVRTGNKMQPTPFAEHIYPLVQHALYTIQQISEPKQNFDISMLKHLKIAVHDEVEPIIVPRLIQHFQKFNIDLQFFSLKLDRKRIVQDLISQQIDFVIDLEQDYGEKLKFQPLVKDYYVVCTQQKVFSLEAYCTAMHIGVSSRRTGVLLEDFYMNRQQPIKRKIFLRCQHYATALQVLQQHTKAMLTIPYSILSHLPFSKKINIYDHPLDLPILNIGFYWYEGLNYNLRLDYLRKDISSIFA